MTGAEALYQAGIAVFPCKADKSPAVSAWKDTALQPPSVHHWPSGLIGIPVPPGAVIVDLDTYKGVTREQVEQILGVSLPWDAALIQTTAGGGQHYAFRADWPVRQITDAFGLRGLDTRVGGKGYICTGEGYTWHTHGVMALAYPSALPTLPDAARPLLEHTAPTRPPAPPQHTDTDTITDALRHIDPGCSRTDWVRVGLALRHHFADDEATGFALFDQWSAGELWPDGCPDNYVPEHMEPQWGSFKPEGDTTIGTLFYEAIQGGWLPPPTLDTAAAFGPGAASADSFRHIVDRIQAHGSDPASTADLVNEVSTLACAPLQRAALLATLNRELKDAGLLTKAIRVQLDDLAGAPQAATRRPGEYGKNHTQNALQFIDSKYPHGTLVRSDEVFYRFDGKVWVEVDDDALRHELTADMRDSWPQHSTVSGTFNMISSLVHTSVKIGDVPDHVVLFQNGVLNRHTGQLMPHDQRYFTTNIMPYSFNPHAECPTWLEFLYDIFEGDAERVALLQEWFGYMLSSGYAHHKVMLMLGPKRSGKGTIGKVLAQVVGPQNFSGGSFTAFCDDAYLDSLRDKPVVFLGDAEQNVPRHIVSQVIERIKSISGNDVITFRRKYKSTLSEALPSRFTIASNSVPKLFDDSGALASRLLVLPFDVSYIDREDPALINKLLADLEGIATWALRGMARLQQQGHFTLPEASQAETQHIAETYSPIEQFIEECCTLGGEHVTGSNEAYEAYRVWAVQAQEGRLLARRTFVNALKDATRGRGCRYGTHRHGEQRVRGFKGLTVSGQAGTGTGTAGAFTPRVVQ